MLEIVFLVDLHQARAVVEEHVDLATRVVPALVGTWHLAQVDPDGVDATPQRLGQPLGLVIHDRAQLVGNAAAVDPDFHSHGFIS